jgi:hypothetical protein
MKEFRIRMILQGALQNHMSGVTDLHVTFADVPDMVALEFVEPEHAF